MKRAFLPAVLILLSGGFHELPRYSAELQLRLSQGDPSIVLTSGDDFTSAPGTVIYISRTEGMRRMIDIARRGDDELAMLYLPEWEAWVTETRSRASDEVRIDPRFLEAALAMNIESEHWHVHNNVQDPDLDPEEIRIRGIQSVMPSPEDLRQYYLFSRDFQGAKFSGVIASIHGALKYWNDNPEWTVPLYVGFGVMQDAHNLHARTEKASVKDLPKIARNHKGHVKLRFEPAR